MKCWVESRTKVLQKCVRLFDVKSMFVWCQHKHLFFHEMSSNIINWQRGTAQNIIQREQLYISALHPHLAGNNHIDGLHIFSAISPTDCFSSFDIFLTSDLSRVASEKKRIEYFLLYSERYDRFDFKRGTGPARGVDPTVLSFFYFDNSET